MSYREPIDELFKEASDQKQYEFKEAYWHDAKKLLHTKRRFTPYSWFLMHFNQVFAGTMVLGSLVVLFINIDLAPSSNTNGSTILSAQKSAQKGFEKKHTATPWTTNTQSIENDGPPKPNLGEASERSSSTNEFEEKSALKSEWFANSAQGIEQDIAEQHSLGNADLPGKKINTDRKKEHLAADANRFKPLNGSKSKAQSNPTAETHFYRSKEMVTDDQSVSEDRGADDQTFFSEQNVHNEKTGDPLAGQNSLDSEKTRANRITQMNGNTSDQNSLTSGDTGSLAPDYDRTESLEDQNAHEIKPKKRDSEVQTTTNDNQGSMAIEPADGSQYVTDSFSWSLTSSNDSIRTENDTHPETDSLLIAEKDSNGLSIDSQTVALNQQEGAIKADITPNRAIWHLGIRAFKAINTRSINQEAVDNKEWTDFRAQNESLNNNWEYGLSLDRTSRNTFFSGGLFYGKYIENTRYIIERTNYMFDTSYYLINPSFTGNGNSVWLIRERIDSIAQIDTIATLKEHTKNVVQYLRVPLSFGYPMEFGNFSIIPNAGLSYTYLYKPSVRHIDQNMKDLGKMNDGIRQHSLSFSAQLRLEYLPTQKWKFGISAGILGDINHYGTFRDFNTRRSIFSVYLSRKLF